MSNGTQLVGLPVLGHVCEKNCALSDYPLFYLPVRVS